MHELIALELARQRVEEWVRYADERRRVPRRPRARPAVRGLAAWLTARPAQTNRPQAAACR